MRAFLLAAGKGSRISKNIPDIPKSALDIRGEALILRTVKMLLANGIDVTVITGYRYRCIERLLCGYPVELINNPFYDVTNSIGSLWMARKSLTGEEDCIVANADVFWSQDILNFVLQQDKDVFLLSDKTRRENGDYFFNTENGVITAYGKDLDYEHRTCEYVGIAFIGKSVVPDFKRKLNALVDTQNHNLWWENALYEMTKERDIYAVDIEGRFWAEIDFIEDYQRIIDYVEGHHEV